MNLRKLGSGFCAFTLVLFLHACGLNPQNADTDLNVTLPEAKLTVYSRAINKIGMMHTIYGAPPLRLMTNNIRDNTGTSSIAFEIPRDITEMVKSTLNAIGEGILYIPYDPEFMLNTASLGYTGYEDKLVPDVMVSGGITEFDRGLVTKGDSIDLDIELGKEYGVNFSDQNKGSLASITLDFNLIDFKTFAGISRIQAINGIKVHKGVKEDSLGFTVKSATFGVKGTIKKVQGRHAAVRLLVQLSMIQILGRYQKLPYWRLIPGAVQDEVVIDQVLSDFYAKSEVEKIATMQSYLYLHGNNIRITGRKDAPTEQALQAFASANGLQQVGIDEQTYMALYESIPLNHQTKQRRKTMPQISQEMLAAIPSLPVIANVPSKNKTLAPVQATSGPGKLKLSANQSNYKVGENMRVSFSVDKPMHVRIVVINSEGLISTLFPNVYQSDSYIKPGNTYQIPPRGADFTLDIGGPVGVDKLRAVASENPIPAEALYFTENGDFDDSKMTNLTVRAAKDITIQ